MQAQICFTAFLYTLQLITDIYSRYKQVCVSYAQMPGFELEQVDGWQSYRAAQWRNCPGERTISRGKWTITTREASLIGL